MGTGITLTQFAVLIYLAVCGLGLHVWWLYKAVRRTLKR
jgi:hypothetical protein